jgi:hypothetical protein
MQTERLSTNEWLKTKFSNLATCPIYRPAKLSYLANSNVQSFAKSLFRIQTDSGVHPTSYLRGKVSYFPGVKSGRGVKLTIHLQLVPRWRTRGSIHPLPRASSRRTAWLVKHSDNFTSNHDSLFLFCAKLIFHIRIHGCPASVPGHVAFVLDRAVQRNVSSKYFGLPYKWSFHQVFHIH